MVNSGSHRRRGRLAIAILVPLGIWLATVTVLSWEPPSRGIDLAAGRSAFRDHCGACHILEKGISTHHGPNLHDIGKTAAARKPGFTAVEYLLESILEPAAFVAPQNRAGMPRNLAADLAPREIRNIVGFLASRGASPPYDEIARLEILDRRPDPAKKTTVGLEKMLLAEKILRDKGSCLQCHTLHRNAEYQVFAPGLFGVGLTDKENLIESIAKPDKVVAPTYRNVNVILASGKLASGRLISRTAEQIALFTRDSENQLTRLEIPIADVEMEQGQPLILKSEQSLMPSGLDRLLTPEELEAVTTLIQQLN